MAEDTVTQQQAIKLKKEKIIKGITCPSCGGELDMNEGVRTFNCKFCGSLLMVKGEQGTLRYYVPRKLKKEDAMAKALNWLGSGLAKARQLKTNAKITEAFPVYIPYWRVKADIVGWVFGREKKTRYVNNRTEYYYEDVEKKIQSEFDRTYSACDVSELGVKQVNLTGDDIFPVDFETLQRDGMMFNVIASEKEAFDFALGEFTSDARSSVKVDEVTFEHFDLVRKKIGIIYYPLWVVRYSFAGRTYQVVVDGEDGTICYGKAPGNNIYRAIAGVLGTGVGIFLTTLFGVFTLGGFTKFTLFLFIAAFAVGIGAVSWGFKKFRYGGEIVEGTGIVKDDKKNKSGKNLSKGASLLNNATGGALNVSKDIAKDVAVSVVIGAVAGAFFNSIKR